MKTPDEFWNEFIEKTGRDNEDKCSGDLTFESQGFQNDSKVTLILSKGKQIIVPNLLSMSIEEVVDMDQWLDDVREKYKRR